MKFSIVTPAYNMERWIRETIESVLSQAGDFFIEYIIVDDNSTDGTGEIIREYAEKISLGEYAIQCLGITMRHIIRDKKDGMYSAINAGFAEAHGDIFAWINADDVYESGTFAIMQKAFETFPEVQWLKGITGAMDASGNKKHGQCLLYSQDWLAKGIYGREAYFVAQDSVFWKAKLWQKVGSIPPQYKYAGDYFLWTEFSKYAPLISLNMPVSYFRRREDQLSKNISEYKREQKIICPKRSFSALHARIFFSTQSHLVRRFPNFEKFFIRFYPIFFGIKRQAEYLEIENGRAIKKETKTYMVSVIQ